jgi:hypothetical protein
LNLGPLDPQFSPTLCPPSTGKVHDRPIVPLNRAFALADVPVIDRCSPRFARVWFSQRFSRTRLPPVVAAMFLGSHPVPSEKHMGSSTADERGDVNVVLRGFEMTVIMRVRPPPGLTGALDTVGGGLAHGTAAVLPESPRPPCLGVVPPQSSG